ncbi:MULTISPECIES: PAS domain S-box protein [Methylomonas]|uniref:PAS domain S-box protein n=1 Tax=Methylomonas TaxID=416 RepID=UPI001231BA94|nr:PAS domain S-box protein [Methylomonas rhizoryzae]
MFKHSIGQSAAILNSDFVALLIVEDMRIVWGNAALHRILGYDPDELIGQPIRMLFLDQESYESFRREANSAIANGNSYSGTIPQQRKDGTTGWYEFNVSSLVGEPDAIVGAIVDRTAWYRTARELQESESRYRSVVEDQIEVISRLLPDGTFLFVNDVYCRVFGKSADELVGNHCWQPIAHPDDLPMIEAKLREMSQDHPVVTIENRVFDGNGDVRWMQFVNRGFYGVDGVLKEIQSVGRDITKLKQVELNLRESEERLQRAQSVARIGSFAMGSDTETFSMTKETARLFDLDDTGVTTFVEWFARVHPDDQRNVEIAWRAALRGAPYDMTYRIVVQGQIRWIRAMADLQFDVDGQLIRAVGTVQDISDLKQIESDLRESDERLEMALAGSELVIWDWKIPEHKVTAGNRWFELLGYTKAELGDDEADWMNLINPKGLQALKQKLLSHLHGETASFESELQLRHKDGHWVSVEARGKVTRRLKDNAPLRMVGTILDVSQRKRLNEEGLNLLKRIEALIRESSSHSLGKADEKKSVENLTKRQRQVLGMIASGMTSAEIGRRLHLSTATVISHRRNLMATLGLHSTAEVTRFAIDHGLLTSN